MDAFETREGKWNRTKKETASRYVAAADAAATEFSMVKPEEGWWWWYTALSNVNVRNKRLKMEKGHQWNRDCQVDIKKIGWRIIHLREVGASAGGTACPHMVGICVES